MAISFHRIAYEVLDICNGVRLEDVLAAVARVGLLPRARVVDIGTGNGTVAREVSERYGVRVTAIEADPSMADLARSRCDASSKAAHVEVVQARAGDVLDNLSPIDLVIALGTTDPAGLGRVTPAGTLTGLAKYLRPGGHLLWGDLTYEGEPPDPIRTFVELTNLYTDDTGWKKAAAAAGLVVISAQRSSQQVWDDYVAAMQSSVERWLADHGDDPDAAQVRTTAGRLSAMFEYGRPWLGFNLYLMQRPNG